MCGNFKSVKCTKHHPAQQTNPWAYSLERASWAAVAQEESLTPNWKVVGSIQIPVFTCRSVLELQTNPQNCSHGWSVVCGCVWICHLKMMDP